MRERRLKVLILGGYGVFGGRIAELLADEPRLQLLIAGRSRDKAGRFCAALPSATPALPVVLDRQGDMEAQLRSVAPDIVVDATGPFQAYGGRPYRVAEACLLLGCDYLDLADASEFVAGISALDAEARAKGRFVLAGASSFPVLTAAVARRLSAGVEQVSSITGGIAPSPYAGVGLNVIKAISAYAGKPLPLVRDGKPARGYGLTETRRVTIAPPGELPLHSTLFSLVDVPDLRVLPALWPGLGSVWIGAGPVPSVLHRMLIGLAWLVRVRLLPSLSPLASLFHWAANTLRWGEHRGGMFVAVQGVAGGRRVDRAWHMIADADDGPYIPAMAVEALVRAVIDGRSPAPGARSAARDLELEDYERLFARRRIRTGVWTPAPAEAPLYRRLLGEAWSRLPPPIREMHELSGPRRARGRARVERGRNPLARLAAKLFGFPEAADDVVIEVAFEPSDGRELWRRDFGGRTFSSTQEAGRGRCDRLLVERFGPFAFGLALVQEGQKLRLVVRRWSLWGLPLPLALAPRSEAYEFVDRGRFAFHVEITQPLVGLIVRYRGWLAPQR